MRRIGSSTRKRAKERLCATHDSPNLCRRFFYFKALFSYGFILLYLAALVSLHFHKKTTDTVVFRLELLPGFEAEARKTAEKRHKTCRNARQDGADGNELERRAAERSELCGAP